MPYAIYPPIGIARLGNSPDQFFIGREEIDGLGIEINQAGERAVTEFKDGDYRMKRQGARFRIFDISDPNNPTEANFPSGTEIIWSVTLANKKDAVVRPSAPPSSPIKVKDDPARTDRVITATASVSSKSPSEEELNGSYKGSQVSLGQLRLDQNGNLIVLAGKGRSETLEQPPAAIGGSFYNNPGWFDDVGDGPISATISVPGQAIEQAVEAWCLTAPPDFAPPANGVVTLYDMIRQVAIDEGWIQAPARPKFGTDIRPIIARASSLQYVDEDVAWPLISLDWSVLSDSSPSSRLLRTQTISLIQRVESTLNDFELPQWQKDVLQAWGDGDFDAGEAVDRGLCDQLTRASLDGALGQGLFPGIEAGMTILDPSRYESSGFEYRLSPTASQPGDLTALMALPWQADFLKCGQGWWPAQRPYRVPTEEGTRRPWLRPSMNHAELVQDAQKLGVLTPSNSGVVEQGRHPDLDPSS